MNGTRGLHHITAIAGPAQENLDFYAGVLGMKLVKKSVNQDDPGTYHLFYADAEGRPGTDLTFFPWSEMAPSRPGHGLANEVALAVPRESLPYWEDRLTRYGGELGVRESRFGDLVLPLRDPHGLRLALVAGPRAGRAPDPRSRRGSPLAARPRAERSASRGPDGSRPDR
jgi:glyoxalase family protein